MMPRYLSGALACVIMTVAYARTSSAQQIGVTTSRDTVRLGDLQADAVHRDPRARQIDILASQSALRQRDIDASRLPSIGANAQAQYQSQVVSLPIQLPSGISIPIPSHDTYDAHVGAQQPIYDPAIGARRNVERAQLAASQAGVNASLFVLRQNVNDAYFSALLQQSRQAEQQGVITDLQAQHAVASDRVREGTALPSEMEMIEAEILKRNQAIAELNANRDAALVVLRDLTGKDIASAETLSLPNLASDVARARVRLDTLHARPEYEQFERGRDVLAQQEASLGAAALPRVSAFGRAGYGRPGLNPLSRDFDRYWLAGVEVDWTPWNWGTTGRDREALALQRQIVATDEEAFQQSVTRSVAHDLANADRLEKALVDDDTIVALRERILKETGFRYREGVITSADYINRETDLLDARLARVTHRVELAQARAHFLTSLGLEVR
jgi:outer membrane protein TolC